MGAKSDIQWTWRPRPDGTFAPGYTFNPWEGCEKVSPGCKNCYAEERDHWLHPLKVMRDGKLVTVGPKHWGKAAPRLFHIDAYWKAPHRWNREAAEMGEQRAVFAASLADVFEDRRDLDASRARLFALVEATPNLEWLFVSKRPENMRRLAPESWGGAWPVNAWAGCTVEDQEYADRRIPHLLDVPATVRFLSCEPMLERVDLSRYLDLLRVSSGWTQQARWQGTGLSWIIIGGESGNGARPFDLAWARDLVKQSRAAGVAPFVKQMGARPAGVDAFGWPLAFRDSHGGDMTEWPEDLRVRELPHQAPTRAA